jgi:hypothetical protein
MAALRIRRRTLLGAGTQALGLTILGLRNAGARPEASLEIRNVLPNARLSGTARLRFFGLNIYDARLWVAPGFQASAFALHPLALELTYLRALNGRSIAERSLKEMQRTAPLATEVAQRWLGLMQNAFPDVVEGDRLTGLHRPGTGAQFWLNGQPRATIQEAEFSRRFFGIWLSEDTSEPRLRTELLAGNTS